MLYCADRSAASNMHHDQIRLFLRLLQEVCDRPENERVAGAMKPVFAQSIFFRNSRTDRIRIYMSWNCLMECGVEVCNTFHLGKLFHAYSNNLESGIIVSTELNPKGQFQAIIISLSFDLHVNGNQEYAQLEETYRGARSSILVRW
jgi:hypothetical protein